MNSTKFLVLMLLVAIVDSQFIDNPPDIERKCIEETVYFNWTYAISSPVFAVEWKKNGSRIALESVGTSQSFTPIAIYFGRLSKISNAQISLGSLTTADSGTYKAEIAYLNGSTDDSDIIRLTVYDVLNMETEILIDESSEKLRPSFYDSSITYTWTSPNNVISTGQYLPVSDSGNYTLCVSEGKARCLNSTINPCASKYVKKGNENESSKTGLIVGVTFGVIALIIIPVGVVFVWKKKGKCGKSENDNGNLENNTGSKTTKDEEGKQSPPTSASKIQLADKLKS